MKRREDDPPPRWRFYFGVEDIDVATKTATDKGATVYYGPVKVLGDAHIIVSSDPQGALFGLVGPRRR